MEHVRRPTLWGACLSVLSIFGATGCFSEPVQCEPGNVGCACSETQACFGSAVCVAGMCEAAATDSASSTAGSSGSAGGSSTSIVEPTSTSTPAVVAESSESSAAGSSSSSGAATSGDESTGTVVVGSSSSDDGVSSESSESSSSSSSEPEPYCGDGNLDPNEQCEGGRGCTECMLDAFPCNPLNNAGCAEGEQCTYIGADFACERFVDEPGDVQDQCTYLYYGYECRAGLSCFSEGCERGFGLCCLPWCDVDGILATCEEGNECRSLWRGYANEYPGLHWLGFCVPQDDS